MTAFTARLVKLNGKAHIHAWHPSTDLIETDSDFIIRVEIAGMSEKDISIHYENNIVVILGKRPSFGSKCAYHRMEIPYGEFSTQIILPDNADIKRASAEYENGFLTIQIPRSQPVNIKISPKKES